MPGPDVCRRESGLVRELRAGGRSGWCELNALGSSSSSSSFSFSKRNGLLDWYFEDEDKDDDEDESPRDGQNGHPTGRRRPEDRSPRDGQDGHPTGRCRDRKPKRRPGWPSYGAAPGDEGPRDGQDGHPAGRCRDRKPKRRPEWPSYGAAKEGGCCTQVGANCSRVTRPAAPQMAVPAGRVHELCRSPRRVRLAGALAPGSASADCRAVAGWC